MQYYRLYFLDRASHIEGAHELHCGGDDEACRHAHALADGRRWELWRGNRRIDCSVHTDPPEPDANALFLRAVDDAGDFKPFSFSLDDGPDPELESD
jgi:hypothetical protein